jgi:hypothetical protein
METFTTLLIYLVCFFINDSCHCETNKPDFKSEYNSSQTIIIGEVLDIKYVKYNIETKKLTYHEDIYELAKWHIINDRRFQEITLKIEKVFKGIEITDTCKVYTDLPPLPILTSSSCQFPFIENGKYLIYSSEVKDDESTFIKHWTDLCTRTVSIVNAGEDLKKLNEIENR